MTKAPGSMLLAAAVVLFSPQAWAQQVAAETPQSMLSAQIRIQGFTCDKALGARNTRRHVSAVVTTPLVQSATALGTDVRTLAATLVCR